MASFEVITTTPLSYFYVEKSTSMDQDAIGGAMGDGFQTVYSHMMASEVTPTGAALAVYTSPPGEKMDFQVGFGVPESSLPKAGNGVFNATLPAQKAVRYLHKGLYSRLGAVYEKIQAQLVENGVKCVGPSWELYLNDPSTVAAEGIETEIYMPVG